MKKPTNRLWRMLALLLAFSLIAAACGDDDDAGDDAPATVLELAIDAGQFSTLVAAIEAADLVDTLEGDGPFTVLAPTDAAFEDAFTALGITADELLADTETLTAILTYHVLPQEADSQLVATLDGQSVPTVNGESVDISVVDGDIMVDQATVVSADLEADNGIVHVINAVLLPDAVAEALGVTPATDGEEAPTTTAPDDDMTEEQVGPGTIVDIAAGNGNFTTLVAALEAADLVDTLSGDGPFTVLAPTDDAFAAALADLGLTADELLASPELAAILSYHVIADEVDGATAISLDGQSVATVNGAEIAISVVDGSVVINDSATVVAGDVEASNGIIHVIDAVLLPPV
jgi:transforming growth factor-beta-induced protein